MFYLDKNFEFDYSTTLKSNLERVDTTISLNSNLSLTIQKKHIIDKLDITEYYIYHGVVGTYNLYSKEFGVLFFDNPENHLQIRLVKIAGNKKKNFKCLNRKIDKMILNTPNPPKKPTINN